MRQKKTKYAYLRLPVATPEEATARREYLIKIGTIKPAIEAYACGHAVPVVGPYCPECGNATVVTR